MATGTRTWGQGVLETNNYDRVDEDFENFIDYIEKTEHPMTAWLNKNGNSSEKKTQEYTLFAGSLIPRTATCTVTITTTDAAAIITVSSTDGIVAKTLLHVPIADGATPGEFLRVTAVTTRLNVTRLTTSAQIPDNSTLVIMGNTDTENSTAGPASFDMEPSSVVGYMTILKRRVDISITEQNSAIRGASSRLEEKLERAKLDFLLDQEHHAWFSRPVKDSTNHLRFSMGIFTQVANTSGTIETDAGGDDLVADDIGDTIAQVARYAKTKRFTCYHGQEAMAGLWKLGIQDLQMRPTDNEWGISVSRVAAPGGFTLDFVYCRVFDIIGYPYDSIIFGADQPQIKQVHLKGGRPKLMRDIQTDDSGETRSHQWRAQIGLYLTQPKRHFIVRDINSV